jgi:hypothetical protein
MVSLVRQFVAKELKGTGWTFSVMSFTYGMTALSISLLALFPLFIDYSDLIYLFIIYLFIYLLNNFRSFFPFLIC